MVHEFLQNLTMAMTWDTFSDVTRELSMLVIIDADHKIMIFIANSEDSAAFRFDS